MKQIRPLLSLFFTLFALGSFSQTGTYALSLDMPKEAVRNYYDLHGVYEFPIRVGYKEGDSPKKPKTPAIKLKSGKRAVMIHSNGDVIKGSWELDKGIIRLKLETLDDDLEYKLVDYESGTYLESMDGRRHYKKK